MPKSKYSISSVADTFGPYVQEQELGNFVAPNHIPTDAAMKCLSLPCLEHSRSYHNTRIVRLLFFLSVYRL